ncbi:MAG: S8/S53 family peptidase [Armatimonadota bacterium]
MDIINFNNANSRDTYFTVHNVKAAHMYARGRGVKVGVIDWLFALDDNKSLYTDSVDIADFQPGLHEGKGHGLWMATVLREIAPECEIVAINGIHNGDGMSFEELEECRSQNLIKSIRWAMESGIDVLTYSHAKVPLSYRQRVANIIAEAVSYGVTTTFIHNDHQDNIWPYGCFPYSKASGDNCDFTREPDVNIYHYDYNTVMFNRYQAYLEKVARGDVIKSGDDLPFFSISSTSPVLGGFVAILKSMEPQLTPAQCKELLISTSYSITVKGENWYDINPCPRVVDIGKAVTSLL